MSAHMHIPLFDCHGFHRTLGERLSPPGLCPTIGSHSHLAAGVHGDPPVATSTGPQICLQYLGQCGFKCTALLAYMGIMLTEHHVLAQVAVLCEYSRPTVLHALQCLASSPARHGTWTRHLYGANMLLINCLPPGRQSFSTCIAGSKAMLYGPTRHMHHGTCHMQDPATRIVPTGATIFLF